MATPRTQNPLIAEARRRLQRRLAARVALVIVSVIVVTPVAVLLGRATRWKGEVLRTGRHVTGIVEEVHVGKGRYSSSWVRIAYDAGSGTRSFIVEPNQLAGNVGDTVDVIYDPAIPRHRRTTWDSDPVPWEAPAGLVIVVFGAVGAMALAAAPRAAIGVRLARGTWTKGHVAVHTGWYGRHPVHAYDFGEDRLFSPGFARLHHPEGRYGVSVAGSGAWRVIAQPGATTVVRRQRTARVDRARRTLLGSPAT